MADETRTILIDVEVEDKDFDKEIGKVNAELKKNRDNIKELSKDYQTNATEIAKLEATNRKLTQSKRQLIKESQLENNSLQALRQRLANLTKERNNTNTATKEGSERFNELQKEILETSEAIKGFEEAGGDFRRNVGNYGDALGEAAGEASLFGVSLNGIKDTFTKLLNPVTAVVGAVGALGAAYLSTGRGARDLARASDRLNSISLQLGNAIADLGGDDEGGAGFLDKSLRFLQTAVLGLSSAMESELQVQAKQAVREFELLQLESDRAAKQALDQAEVQRQIRDEERNSLAERREANEELGRIINAREAEQVKAQESLIENLKFLLNLDKDNLELQLRLKQAEFELADIREEAQGFRSEQLINDLGLAREQAEFEVGLLQAQTQEKLILAEEGSKEELEIKKELIRQTSELELSAAGENEILRQTIIQTANNAILALDLAFQEQLSAQQKQALEQRNEDALKSAEERWEEEIKLYEEGVDEEKKQIETVDVTRKELQEGALSSLAAFGKKGSAIGKSAAITQLAADTAKGISGATAAAQSVPFPGNLLAIVTGVGAVLANIAKAKQALNSGGRGGGGAVSASSPALSAQAVTSQLANVNASLLSQFSQPAQAQADQTDAIIKSSQRQQFVAVTDINTAQDKRSVKVTEAEL